jgi:hypothetical protein
MSMATITKKPGGAASEVEPILMDTPNQILVAGFITIAIVELTIIAVVAAYWLLT